MARPQGAFHVGVHALVSVKKLQILYDLVAPRGLISLYQIQGLSFTTATIVRDAPKPQDLSLGLGQLVRCTDVLLQNRHGARVKKSSSVGTKISGKAVQHSLTQDSFQGTRDGLATIVLTIVPTIIFPIKMARDLRVVVKHQRCVGLAGNATQRIVMVELESRYSLYYLFQIVEPDLRSTSSELKFVILLAPTSTTFLLRLTVIITFVSIKPPSSFLFLLPRS